jgi:hypothetical protein
VFKFGGRLSFCTLGFLILLYCISCDIWDNVSFKFGGVDKYYVYLFDCFICLYIFVFVCI